MTNNAVWDRFILICKPEQSGKTFVMIEKINEAFDETDCGKITVNFIFCDNSLLLTKQTSNRVGNEVKTPPGCTNTYVEFSSAKNAETQSEVEVKWGIVGQGITNIICCTNMWRVRYVMNIIKDLNKCMKGKYIFKIWIDEADKFNTSIDKFIPFAEENENVHFFCMTATPEALFRKYSYMMVLPLENTTCEDYHGWGDNNIEIRDNEYLTTEGFVNKIIVEVMEQNNGVVPPGTLWYIPADRKKSSHEKMRELLIAKGFAVFVVNGNGLELALPDGTHIIKDKTKELHELVRELYREYDISRFPLAMTGYICIGRGVSIMQEGEGEFDAFIFNFSILSNCTNKAEASQQAGRGKGNIKNWNGYEPQTVYTTAEFNKVATEWEHRSRDLATLAFSHNQRDPTVITKNEFRSIGGSGIDTVAALKPEPVIKVFNTQEEVKKYFRTEGKGKVRGTGPRIIERRGDGYYTVAIRKGKNDERRVCSCDDIYKERRSGLGKSVKYRVYPCYKNVEDQNTLQWWLIYY